MTVKCHVSVKQARSQGHQGYSELSHPCPLRSTSPFTALKAYLVLDNPTHPSQERLREVKSLD